MGILLLRLCLGGAAWTAVRFAQSASKNNQEAVLETSRQVVPQTIPEGGAETFQKEPSYLLVRQSLTRRYPVRNSYTYWKNTLVRSFKAF